MSIDVEKLSRVESTGCDSLALSDDEVYEVLRRKSFIHVSRIEAEFVRRHADLFNEPLKQHKGEEGDVIGVERPGAFVSWVSGQRQKPVMREEAFEINNVCISVNNGESVSPYWRDKIAEIGLHAGRL